MTYLDPTSFVERIIEHIGRGNLCSRDIADLHEAAAGFRYQLNSDDEEPDDSRRLATHAARPPGLGAKEWRFVEMGAPGADMDVLGRCLEKLAEAASILDSAYTTFEKAEAERRRRTR